MTRPIRHSSIARGTALSGPDAAARYAFSISITLSILTDSSLTYPVSTYGYSPSKRFPEYPFDDVAGAPNPVYASVRALFRQSGLDSERFGTADWNPLGGLVPAEQRFSVFVLCSFV